MPVKSDYALFYLFYLAYSFLFSSYFFSFFSKRTSVFAGTLAKLDLFQGMRIFWKHCRLVNPISIVLSDAIVWKCCPWHGMNILEILSKYSGNKTSVPWNRSSCSRGISINLRNAVCFNQLLIFNYRYVPVNIMPYLYIFQNT